MFLSNIILTRLSGTVLKDGVLVLNISFMVIYIVITIIIIAVYSNMVYRDYKMKQDKHDFENLMVYNQEIEKQYSNIRRFKHDYKNILLSMGAYIEDKDFSGLETYFNTQINKSYDDIKNDDFKLECLSKIEVKELKSIISANVIRAIQAGYEVNVEVVEVIDNIKIDPIVMVRVVGILFDNALEELNHLGLGKLSVSLFKEKSSIVLIIENTCRKNIEPIRVLKRNGFSTKGLNRGIGFSSLEKLLIESPNVYWETIIKDEKFTNVITIGR
ncbi:MAG: GHKL domain-containing protein [Bacilli bacterium]